MAAGHTPRCELRADRCRSTRRCHRRLRAPVLLSWLGGRTSNHAGSLRKPAERFECAAAGQPTPAPKPKPHPMVAARPQARLWRAPQCHSHATEYAHQHVLRVRISRRCDSTYRAALAPKLICCSRSRMRSLSSRAGGGPANDMWNPYRPGPTPGQRGPPSAAPARAPIGSVSRPLLHPDLSDSPSLAKSSRNALRCAAGRACAFMTMLVRSGVARSNGSGASARRRTALCIRRRAQVRRGRRSAAAPA